MTKDATPELSRRLRMAARALGRAGLAHAYGHVSVRIDDQRFLVCPSRPMGLIEPDELCQVVTLDEPLPPQVLGEVRVHREIYRNRADVGAITRTMPPNIMVLAAHGVVPLPRHGFGTYFHPAPAFWDDVQLLRDDDAAIALAATMGTNPAIVMRGNGAVVAGETLEQAVVLTWYLEDMARIELAGRSAGLQDVPVISAEACAKRAIWQGAIAERMFDYLTNGDPEA